MAHEEWKNIADNARTAVVFIHGIAGTPDHFRDFLPLVPKTFSVYNILLDGHGKGVTDFSKTSMKKWESQVAQVICDLSATHEELYIVGHSMGTLFAMEQAMQNPSVKKLFLLATPLRLGLKPRLVVNAAKVFFNRIGPADLEAIAAKNCYGIGNDKNIFHYFGWIPRFLELFSKIRAVRKILNTLQTPCAVFQSRKDEMVSTKSIGLLKDNPAFSVSILENSSHFYYESEDMAILTRAFSQWLSQ